MVTSGGVAPLLYSLNGVDFQTTTSFSGLGPGTYTVTVKDDNSCVTTTDIVVSEGNDPSNITFTETNYDCAAGTVDLSLNVVDGNPPYTFEIIAPVAQTSTDNTFTGLTPGTYTFEVTAADGCKIVRNYNVSDPIRLQLTTTLLNQVSCFNDALPAGRLSFTVTDFIGSYDYTVTNGAGTVIDSAVATTTNTIELADLPAETYDIAVTNTTSGCIITDSITIEEPAQPLAVASLDVVPYNCGQEGSVLIDATGGWGGYSYSVERPDGTNSPVQNTPLIIGLDQEGTHRVFLIDINGCVNSETTFDLVYNDGPDIAINEANSNFCYQSDNKGIINIDIINGVQPLSYVLNGADPVPIPATDTSINITELSPDTYDIKVVDGTGCFTELTGIQMAGQLFMTPTVTRILGCGATPNAEVRLDVSGGYAPYTYEVSKDNGAYTTTTAPFNTTDPGNYAFRITDDRGCVYTTESIDIAPRQDVTATEDITLTRCGLEGTGAVLLNPTSGVPPFQFSFDGSPFSGQELYTGLDAKDYTYTIRDAANCELTKTITVGSEDPLEFNVFQTPTTCPDDPTKNMNYGFTHIREPMNVTGDIRIELVRVRSPENYDSTGYEHVFRNYQDIDPVNQYQVGGEFQFKIRMYWEAWFFVRITDGKGCQYTSDFFFHDQPDLPTTWAGRARNADGTFIDQDCSNGGPVFDVEIVNGGDLVGPFEYFTWPRDIEDTDGDGNIDITGWLPVDSPDNPHPDVDLTPGVINTKIRISQPRDVVHFGIGYRIIVRDLGTGCLRWRWLGQIEGPSDLINVEVKRRGRTCWDSNDAMAEFTITNHNMTGSVEYKIREAGRPDRIIQDWTPVPGNDPELKVLVNNHRLGWHVVEVRDSRNCITAEEYHLHRGNSPLELDLLHKINASCNYGGQIAVDASGGWYETRRFQWSNNLNYYPWRDYQYAFVPSDRTLQESDWITESSVVVNPTAFDGVSNVYRVYTRDANNCVVELASPVTIDLEPIPEIQSVDVTDRCTALNEQYTVVATATGGVGTLEYVWNGETTTDSTKILGPGNHTLEIKDENGCFDSETFTIYPQFNAQLTTTKKVACDPANDGEITIEVYGGTGDFTFEQITPAGANNTTGVFGGLTHSTLYEFRVTDNINSCAPQVLSITLDAPVDPVFEVKTPIQNVSCNGAADGKIIIIPTPGSNQVDAPYTYSLDGVNYQPSNLFQDLAPGSYTASVRSKLGCVQTLAPVTVTEPAVLSRRFFCNTIRVYR